jgi:hypothetical protein
VTDSQIVNSEVEAAPAVYTLPAAIAFVLKAVSADFDGSAAGSFLPAVVITSDSGHVIARACDPANPVSAGGSAEASFFPGVKIAGAGAATALNIPWAIIDSQDGEAMAHSGGMTFTFATANFNTNDSGVFSLRPFSPPFQGIALLQTGVYYVSWWVQALVNGNLATPPSATMIDVTPGSSFADTFVNEVDLTRADDYGRITQGTSPNLNVWDVRYVALVGVASVTGQRWVNLGAFNRSSTFDFPATGGQGLFGRIFVMRLSDGLASYATFF